MLSKKFQLLSGTLLCLPLLAAAHGPAKAQLPMAEKAEVMFGHPSHVNIEETAPEATAIGRVRGIHGDILSVEFINPETVTIDDREVSSINMQSPSWHITSGSDIVLAYKDGRWQYVSDANRLTFDWLSRLNLKGVTEVESVAVDFSAPREVGLPPVQPRASIEPAAAPVGPIRGMW